ncbi:efflux RND transporter permease subunit [Magnetospirillum sp. UT-4]|uniref:efflux RND transporter permease subunit n=1 Tax=Magnetospirillum sp. UT-4 TaxID=2681467 RepID=UPI001380B30C|nr:efflux RND transporter permease subunit [Magnetospirillum sp. UT-4]CAA7620538.1 putative cation/multidrug efflux pump of the AcrB/AcrD/AcrF family [Magnetospirillum sp. UT-4]
MKLGISGGIAQFFIKSPLTPLLLLFSLMVGAIALSALPREEEPQISVPMVDIMVEANGFKAADAAELVTKPLEDIVKGIDAVEHVYSQTWDDRVVVTARFDVGTSEDAAILRVHQEVRANMRAIPTGIPEPLIIGRGINDVAVVVLTLSPRPERADNWNDNALFAIAEQLQHELVKVNDVGLSYIVGGRKDEIRVEPDPEKLALYGVTLNQLVEKVENANRSFMVGAVRQAGRELPVVGGQTLKGVPDIGNLLLMTRDGRPVYVKDVAAVVVGGEQPRHRAWHAAKTAEGKLEAVPTVSLAIAKRAGANAVTVADEILARLDHVHGSLIPEDIAVDVTRNYGATALDKADELLFHLGLATLSIVLLITWALGWREGVVVALVVPTTILLTLFASWLMGYTINRVSLFALIFSIGILVDDAIVVVENIVRHWLMRKGEHPMDVAVEAVAEVGNPTIVATLTIVAALLPMMFVSGLMGPYMSPIPANASSAMLFSFFVAVIITPWLLLKVAGKARGEHHGHGDNLGDFYRRIATPIVADKRRAKKLLLWVAIGTVLAMMMFPLKAVTVKLLPFDNKSELQVMVDLPEGSTLEATERVLLDAVGRLRDVPELVSVQAYAGTAAPFNFNGLVRHSYLRASPELGDLQINLTSRHDRDRASHAIALDVRERLKGIALPEGAALKVVEVPPGPPVLSTLLAEIYGPDSETRRRTAAEVREAFAKVDFVVDVDDTLSHPWQRLRVAIDQERLEYFGVEQEAVYDTIQALMGGVSVGYSHRGEGATPKQIVVALARADQRPGELLATTPVPARGRSPHDVEAGSAGTGTVELGDVVEISVEPASPPIFRRDGRYAEMVTADLAGRFEAPIYGMFAVEDHLPAGIEVKYHGQPLDESRPTLLWDGEWEITYVTFRDMGAAFGVAILGIYLLVVAQFGSFRLPLVILVPVPLTLIGIVIGHMLFNAPFSATSMIGFIALAGIIVRNSILLVDFIRGRLREGASIREAVLDSGATRFKPIALTAAAAMIGAAFILADPIFQGLAISLVFGLLSSTALTLLVIPALYVWLRDDGRELK